MSRIIKALPFNPPGEAMKEILFIALILSSSALWAKPAAWYWWHSALSDQNVCSQTSPGEGWVIVKGPFEDAVCKKRGVPH
jgi:hypothetical protein